MGGRCPDLLVPARCAGGGRGCWESLLTSACGAAPSGAGAWLHLHGLLGGQRRGCEQFRQARRGVAHCCARGHEGAPLEVEGAAALSRVLQAWLAPAEPPPEPPAKRPCVAPAPAVVGHRQWLDYCTPSPPARCGRVQSTLP